MTNVFVGKHSELTDKILECFWVVYQELGYGFNEKAYEKALVIVLELKATNRLLPEHEAQMLNYLKATPFEVGLVLNFGPKGEIRRKVFDNHLKGLMKWTNKSEDKPEENKSD